MIQLRVSYNRNDETISQNSLMYVSKANLTITVNKSLQSTFNPRTRASASPTRWHKWRKPPCGITTVCRVPPFRYLTARVNRKHVAVEEGLTLDLIYVYILHIHVYVCVCIYIYIYIYMYIYIGGLTLTPPAVSRSSPPPCCIIARGRSRALRLPGDTNGANLPAV